MQIGNVTTYIGFGASETEFEGWEFEYPGVGTVTAALTTTDPPVPILRQYICKCSARVCIHARFVTHLPIK